MARLRPATWSLFFALLTLSMGCATYSERIQDAREDAAKGHYGRSLSDFNKALRVEEDDEFPGKLKPDDGLLMLERGAVLQADERYAMSATNLKTADQELEMLDVSGDTAGNIGKYIYSDSATKYKASPTEAAASVKRSATRRATSSAS